MTTLPIEHAPAAPADARPTPVRRRRLTLSGVNIGDRLYQVVLTGLTLTPPLLLLTLLAELAVSAWPAIRRFGVPFLWTSVWDPVAGVFGAAPMIFGTLASSLLALLIAVPLLLAGAVILAIMIVPYIAAVSREVLLAVPASQREAAVGMGATRWEAVWTAVVPYGRAGLVGAVILGLGRALGETMAVTMLIGNRHDIGLSLLQPAYTMAAAIANEFSEATTDIYLSALFEVGLILFVLTVVVNALARLLIWRVARGTAVGSRAL